MTSSFQNRALRSVRIIAGLLVVIGLFLARSILIPAALAILFCLLLDPLVKKLQRLHLSKGIAVALVIFGLIGVVGSLAMVVGQQMIEISLHLPDYKENLQKKIHALRSSGESRVAKLTGTLHELSAELSATRPAEAVVKNALDGTSETPVRVEVVNSGIDVSQIADFLGPAMVPVAGAAVTLLLLSFLLLQSDDMRARLVTYAGVRQVSINNSAMNEISHRIGRYLRMLLLINFSYGVMIGTGLACIGVPKAIMWGSLGFALRFIPYIGPWLAAILPLLLTVAVFPGWATALMVIGLFVVVEAVTNLILEPWLFGASTGISSLGVVCASVFWGWLWGPIGLIISVPITASLIVVGKYVPQWALLNHLFGTDAEVPVVGELYQHLLSGNTTAADHLISQASANKPLEQVCDQILLPVLSELKRDLSVGSVDPSQGRRVLSTIEMIVGEQPSHAEIHDVRLLCVAGSNEVDACAAYLLALACQSHGVSAQAVSSQPLAGEIVNQAAEMHAATVAVVQVAPVSVPHSRRLIKALVARFGTSVDMIDLSFGVAPGENDSATAANPSIAREQTFTRVIAPLIERASLLTLQNGKGITPGAAA